MKGSIRIGSVTMGIGYHPLCGRLAPQSFPRKYTGLKESLHDLLTEYVDRKYAVLAEFMDQMPIMRRGVMSTTV